MNVVRQLRDYAVAAVLAIIVATGAFVIERNTDLIAKQTDLATRAASAIAQGRQMPDVHAVIVGPSVPSKTRPYLRERSFVEHINRDAPLAKTAWKPLVASAGPDAKLFYDAANKFEREHVSDTTATVAMLADSTGRAIAVTRANNGLAIALTPPARPAPFPLLVLVGVLGLGAVLAAAGAIVGGRAALLGTVAGVGALAVPCVLWSSWIAATAIFLLGAALAAAQQVRWTDRFAQGLRLHRTALAFLAPAMTAMLILVAAPFIIGVLIGFYDHHQGQWTFVGIHNFGEILTGGGRPMDDPLNFWFILGVTVLWTAANVALHVSIGVALALLLSRTWLRGKGIFRMLLIVPWAVPNYITALMWKGVFTGEYGAMNSLLKSAGLDSVSWFSSWAASFTANVTTNTWLGFPFMMVVALGALESIPKELYEAASVDGASAWQRFRHITMPHLRPALGPAVVLGSIWTFNQFNVIYLVSAGQPGGATNILVTDAYRWAFERGERYGMAAAYATIIFLILLLWTVFGSRITRNKETST